MKTKKPISLRQEKWATNRKEEARAEVETHEANEKYHLLIGSSKCTSLGPSYLKVAY